MRAIPPLQNIFKSFSDLKFNTLVIEKMIKSYKIDNLNYNLDYKKISPIEFSNSIILRNVTFNYFNNNQNIFEDLSLEIKKIIVMELLVQVELVKLLLLISY